MRYYYGTETNSFNGKGIPATAKKLASIIRRDVEFGKWNIYNGGTNNSSTATCSYEQKGFVFHGKLFIQGKQKEFEQLEQLITSFIEVIPRKFEK